MDISKILLDIVDHTGNLGFINNVKVTGSSMETLIESIDEEKSVIVNGVLNSNVKEFEGTFGINYLNVLKGLLNHPKFKLADSEILIFNSELKPKKIDENPAGILFRNKKLKIDAYLRFSIIGDSLNVPKFKGANWNIKFNVDDSSYEEFKSLNNLFSSFEDNFIPELKENGDLYFHIGDPSVSDNRTSFLFHKEEGKFTPMPTGFFYPSNKILTILGLKNSMNNNEPIEMAFSDKGVLQITIKSEYAVWKYILPAKKK